MATVEDKVVGYANAAFLTAFHNSLDNDYPLSKSTLLDSRTHLTSSMTSLDFRTSGRLPGTMLYAVAITLHGFLDMERWMLRNKRGILRIRNAVYCPDFMTNLICFASLRERNIFWDTERIQQILG